MGRTATHTVGAIRSILNTEVDSDLQRTFSQPHSNSQFCVERIFHINNKTIGAYKLKLNKMAISCPDVQQSKLKRNIKTLHVQLCILTVKNRSYFKNFSANWSKSKDISGKIRKYSIFLISKTNKESALTMCDTALVE